VRELELVGLRVEMPANTPVLILKETEGSRVLPIWIGAVEATAIAVVQQGLEPQRPLTHDLLANVIEATGHALTAVSITGLDEGVFYAELELSDGITVSARPSDAVALAIRVGCPILCDDAVLDEAGVEGLTADGDESDLSQEDAAVEEFREFLDQVTPEDFEQG
jgi:bifunctional DNase/RNase